MCPGPSHKEPCQTPCPKPQQSETPPGTQKSETLCLGTPKGHKHKHFMGISLPYWASLQGGFIWDSNFCLCAFLGPLCAFQTLKQTFQPQALLNLQPAKPSSFKALKPESSYLIEKLFRDHRDHRTMRSTCLKLKPKDCINASMPSRPSPSIAKPRCSSQPSSKPRPEENPKPKTQSRKPRSSGQGVRTPQRDEEMQRRDSR